MYFLFRQTYLRTLNVRSDDKPTTRSIRLTTGKAAQLYKATLIEQQLILLDWRCESVLFPVFQFLTALYETRSTQPAHLALRASPLSTHI